MTKLRGVRHAYPDDLAEAARGRWKHLSEDGVATTAAQRAALEHGALEMLLSVAYQSSMLTEEGRPCTFRMLVAEPDDLDAGAGPPDGLHRLRFAAPYPLTPHEVRKLSRAAKPSRALLGVRVAARGPEIWGLLHSGPRWLQATHGGRGVRTGLPPGALVIASPGVGQVTVSRGVALVAELRAGMLITQPFDVLASGWLPGWWRPIRDRVMEEHRAARPEGETWGDVDPNVIRLIAVQLLKRIIATVRDAGHGGTLLVVPDVEAIANVVQIHHAFADEEPRRRYRTLLQRALAILARSTSTSVSALGWDAYDTSESPELAQVDEAILEIAHLIANLADVDGAVVITRRFEILGFGAEIVGRADVGTIRRALDLEARHTVEESSSGVGTRHRSAYRFIAQLPDAVAIVISQEGSVRFVHGTPAGVTCWNHVPSAENAER